MKSLRERYLTDAHFKTMVDMLASFIRRAEFTPSEVREAAILASIIYEEENLRMGRGLLVERDMEEALRTIRNRVER